MHTPTDTHTHTENTWRHVDLALPSVFVKIIFQRIQNWISLVSVLGRILYIILLLSCFSIFFICFKISTTSMCYTKLKELQTKLFLTGLLVTGKCTHYILARCHAGIQKMHHLLRKGTLSSERFINHHRK